MRNHLHGRDRKHHSVLKNITNMLYIFLVAELNTQLNESNVKMLITQPDLLDKALEAAKQCKTEVEYAKSWSDILTRVDMEREMHFQKIVMIEIIRICSGLVFHLRYHKHFRGHCRILKISLSSISIWPAILWLSVNGPKTIRICFFLIFCRRCFV